MEETPSSDPWAALAARLPAMVQAQFDAYRRLVEWQIPEEDGPRELTQWENARKAALAHLQSLIRIHDLVQVRSLEVAAEDESPELAQLLSAVRQELSTGSADERGEGVSDDTDLS